MWLHLRWIAYYWFGKNVRTDKYKINIKILDIFNYNYPYTASICRKTFSLCTFSTNELRNKVYPSFSDLAPYLSKCLLPYLSINQLISIIHSAFCALNADPSVEARCVFWDFIKAICPLTKSGMKVFFINSKINDN